ncbi:hypothetical protein CEE37_11515 [candidate division LCP-89 bacterium B3_LCP]|uniref:NIF system FeS cluster assembly NifU N-terminal domain-containing protein n=1 Tax=candidate division LCP-89 bacterium B3_LCP TaxID=2012998 RepID=A0A532UVT5_UNCL8|nr:MAG: hypothetical protein CEE37_11515 [candidate division LCP-89 bacterium B3_LCP]
MKNLLFSVNPVIGVACAYGAPDPNMRLFASLRVTLLGHPHIQTQILSNRAKMYTKEYMRHFSNPQNVGDLENPDAVEDVYYKGGGCFDKVRIFIKINDGKVSEVTYRTRGCSGTIAACSAMSEMAVGMDLDRVAEITGDNIADSLGGVPEKKQHSMDLAAEALRSAVLKL